MKRWPLRPTSALLCTNDHGYIGWAETGPIAKGQKYLATITHCDVVPAGNGWDADPFHGAGTGWLAARARRIGR